MLRLNVSICQTAVRGYFGGVKLAIHWFRRDLRVNDNAALSEATARAERVVPVFIAEDALRTGPVGGAGFDVLTHEPPPDDNVLLQLRLPNFILTPHVAWASAQAMQSLADQLVDNIEAFVAGTPVNAVT